MSFFAGMFEPDSALFDLLQLASFSGQPETDAASEAVVKFSAEEFDVASYFVAVVAQQEAWQGVLASSAWYMGAVVLVFGFFIKVERNLWLLERLTHSSIQHIPIACKLVNQLFFCE